MCYVLCVVSKTKKHKKHSTNTFKSKFLLLNFPKRAKKDKKYIILPPPPSPRRLAPGMTVTAHEAHRHGQGTLCRDAFGTTSTTTRTLHVTLDINTPHVVHFTHSYCARHYTLHLAHYTRYTLHITHYKTPYHGHNTPYKGPNTF